MKQILRGILQGVSTTITYHYTNPPPFPPPLHVWREPAGLITDLRVGANSSSTLEVKWTWNHLETYDVLYLVSWSHEGELGHDYTRHYSYVITGLKDCTVYIVTVTTVYDSHGESSNAQTFLKGEVSCLLMCVCVYWSGLEGY